MHEAQSFKVKNSVTLDSARIQERYSHTISCVVEVLEVTVGNSSRNSIKIGLMPIKNRLNGPPTVTSRAGGGSVDEIIYHETEQLRRTTIHKNLAVKGTLEGNFNQGRYYYILKSCQYLNSTVLINL